MLFLLRNIRRKLLTNNKVMTYLLYAIGEIVLVVVGILIAVSIDDWDNKGKLKELEVKTLQELKASMEQAIVQLDKSIEGFTDMENGLRVLLDIMEEKGEIPDSIVTNLRYLLGSPVAKFNFIAYENLKTRGPDLISNEELKKMILNIYEVEFYYMTEELAKNAGIFNSNTTNLYMKYFRMDFRMINDQYEFESIPVSSTNMQKAVRDSEFVNSLYFAHGMKVLGRVRSKLTKERVEKVHHEITEELNRLD